MLTASMEAATSVLTAKASTMTSYLATANANAARAVAQGGSNPAALVVLAQVQAAWAKRAPLEAPAHRLLARRALQETLKKDPAYQPALKCAALIDH